MREAELAIGGFSPLSTCDWPGELVATVFCQGCPLLCRYCHNPELIPPGPGAGPGFGEVLGFLEARRGLLDGVVFSGGEPTLQPGLPEAIRALRQRGFRIGLHTAGPFPSRLARLLPLLDWIGFDVKAPFDDYARITGVPGSGERARHSLIEVARSGVAFEVRTTVHPLLTGEDDLARLDADLAALGVPPSRRQPFRPLGCRDPELVAAHPLLGSAPSVPAGAGGSMSHFSESVGLGREAAAPGIEPADCDVRRAIASEQALKLVQAHPRLRELLHSSTFLFSRSHPRLARLGSSASLRVVRRAPLSPS